MCPSSKTYQSQSVGLQLFAVFKNTSLARDYRITQSLAYVLAEDGIPFLGFGCPNSSCWDFLPFDLRRICQFQEEYQFALEREFLPPGYSTNGWLRISPRALHALPKGARYLVYGVEGEALFIDLRGIGGR